MTTEEFDQLFTILTQSQYITGVDSGAMAANLELPETFQPACSYVIPLYHYQYFRENYRDKLKDGANLVDLYRDALVFANNFDTKFGTEYEDHFMAEFWEIAREVLVEPEELDEPTQHLTVEIAYEFDEDTPKHYLDNYNIPCNGTNYAELGELAYPIESEEHLKRQILEINKNSREIPWLPGE